MEVPPNSLYKEEVNTNNDLGWRALGGGGGRMEPATTINAGASSWWGSFTQCGGTPRMMAGCAWWSQWQIGTTSPACLGSGRDLHSLLQVGQHQQLALEVVEIFTVFCRLDNIISLPWKWPRSSQSSAEGCEINIKHNKHVQQGGAQFFFSKWRTFLPRWRLWRPSIGKGGRELQVRVRPP